MNWNDFEFRAIRERLQTRALTNPMDAPPDPLILNWGRRRYGLCLNNDMSAMGGKLSWMASVSIDGTLASKWRDETLAREVAGLDFVLQGMGDSREERCIVTPAVFCKHRSVSARELVDGPKWISQIRMHRWGNAPFRVFRETETYPPEAQPCERAQINFHGVPELIQCKKCGPCRARKEMVG